MSISAPNPFVHIAAVTVLIGSGPATAEVSQASSDFDVAYARYTQFIEQDDFKSALPEAKQLYELGEQLLEPSDETLGFLTFNYGVTLQRTSNRNEARPILSKALQRYENSYGKKSAELIPVLLTLGNVHAKIFEPKKQLAYYRRALSLAEGHFGKHSTDYAGLSLRAGSEVLTLSRSADGEKYITDAYSIYAKLLEPDDPRRGRAAFFRGKVELTRRHYQQAEKYLVETVGIYSSNFEHTTQLEQVAHGLLVHTYETMGESEKATKHCIAIGRMKPKNPDQEYLPVFRMAPDYPSSMLSAGRDGYVDVQFTVDESGFVNNAKVVSGEGGASFHRPALNAVKRFRYAPQFAGGEPVATQGVETRIRFEIENR